MPKTSNLSIDVPGVASLQQSDARSGLASPHTPHTPRSPPSHNGTTIANGASENNKAHFGEGYDNHIHSPINALPPPRSPRSPKPGSKTAKIFGNTFASKSLTKLNKSSYPDHSPLQPAPPPSSIGGKSPNANANANASQVYLSASSTAANNTGVNKSSPDVSVSHVHSGQSSPDAVEFSPESTTTNTNHDGTGASSSAKEKGAGHSLQKSKTQHKFGNFLNRKSSLREDELVFPLQPTTAPLAREKPKPGPIKTPTLPIDVPVRTAPVEKERGFRSAMNSALRNRSLDRNIPPEDERLSSSQPHAHKPSSLGPNGLHSSSNTTTHTSLVSNIRSGSNRAAEGINKARKGLLSNFKLNRSGSSHEREPMRNEPYELKVLVLPLEEQARITRIAKRLHYCKDKTEFWLPAFPYRCIDYLSDRGTYSEGLYRVPGSELEIKHYMARFDREHDIDLFEIPDLHDVNVVATMLKRYLSNLPPVLSPTLQSDIINHCSTTDPAVPGATTPTYMKDALSTLPPWNYYLLFAITGHISFLHNHREQNKMTYENLFRCFATRALQVEPYIFWWLVWDWRGCWAGCTEEDEYKVREYEILDREAREREDAELEALAEKERERGAAGKRADKMDANGMARQQMRAKAGKHSVSAISKQSVPKLKERETIRTVKGSGEQRPQTAHAKSQSQSQARSRSRDRAQAAREAADRELEREREKERERERALSSSDSSKPSITGQSSAGGRSASPSTGHTGREEDENVKEDKERLGAREASGGKDMGLPMLSPLKPLSPLGLH